MDVIDYNGEGEWASEAILQRYARHSKHLQIDTHMDLTPRTIIQGDKTWIYPVMERVIEGIETGDIACQWIGIEFIEQDQKFPFGKILKSNAARALRRALLTDQQQERIRTRLVSMILAENVPHEFKEYAKLLKKIGLGRDLEDLEAKVNRSNPYVMRYYHYLVEEPVTVFRDRKDISQEV